MDAKNLGLFDEIELAEAKTCRAIDRIDSDLRRLGVSALQRAVITLLIGHHESRIVGDQVRLEISLADAADWIREYAPAARGLVCDRSNIRRAIEYWRRCEVLIHQQVGDVKQILLSQSSFSRWLAQCPDFETLAVLFQETVTDRDPLGPTVTDRDPLGPTVTDRDPSLNESMNEESSFIRQHEPQKPAELPVAAQTPDPATPSEIGRLLAGLPELPDEVWFSTSDAGTWSIIRAWWEKNGLTDRCGPQAESVGATLIGLLEASRRARDPAAFFYRSRATPKHYLEANGRRWMRRVAAEKHKTEPMIEPTINSPAWLRARRMAATV